MATNPSITTLDAAQVVKRCFDSTNDAQRVILGAGTEFAVALDAADGDSVTAIPSSIFPSGSLTTLTTGTIVAETACIGIKSVVLYSKTLTAITTPPTLTVETSPLDAGDFWFATATTIVPDVTANVVLATAIGTVCARRIRVRTSAATAVGTATIGLVGQSV